MANHKSALKRARQNPKRAERNVATRSRVKSATKVALSAPEAEKSEKLSAAFSVIQKSRGVFHRNAVRRKMARLSKALAKKKA